MRNPLHYSTPDLYFPDHLVHAADLSHRREDGTLETEQDCLDRLASNAGLYGTDPCLILEMLEDSDTL